MNVSPQTPFDRFRSLAADRTGVGIRFETGTGIKIGKESGPNSPHTCQHRYFITVYSSMP